MDAQVKQTHEKGNVKVNNEIKLLIHAHVGIRGCEYVWTFF